MIGAGIAGLMVARELASRGASVEVADPRGPMGGATGAASGIVTLQLPEPPLSWSVESLDLYESLGVARRLPGILVAPGECIGGLLELRYHGVEAGALSPGEASRLAGLPIEPPNGWGTGYTLEALVDLGGLLSRLTSPPPGPIRPVEADPWRALRDGFDVVVVAAGAWTPMVLGAPASEVAGSALYNCEASSVRLPGGSLEAILYVEHDGESAYAVPEAPGRAIVGDGPNRILGEPGEAAPEPGTPYEVLEELARVSPVFEESYPTSSWAAPCMITGDGLPAVGEWVEGVYVFAGLDGYGLMAAPALARLLADAITRGRPLPASLDPHRRARPWSGEGPPPEPWRTCGS